MSLGVCDPRPHHTQKIAQRSQSLKSRGVIPSDTQKAQLSQKGRTMLGVTEYFAKSLKVTKGQFEITPLSRLCVNPY